MDPAPHLVVIDGDNLVHRTFHSPSDRPAADRFGFMLGRLRKAGAPTHMVIVWDPDDDGPRWRRELWPDYKSGRAERPEGLDQLFVDAKAECEGWRLAQAQVDGVEGDDLVGAYVEAAVTAGMEATIVSNDKDMLQLVRDTPVQVRMRDDARKLIWGPPEIAAKFGVEPGQIADYLALVGDASDGFPGVPGIGAKTAKALLAQYGTLEQVLSNAPLIRSTATMKRLLAHAEQARVCYRLARLQVDAALPVTLAATALARG
jgi:DNA polymerase-1